MDNRTISEGGNPKVLKPADLNRSGISENQVHDHQLNRFQRNNSFGLKEPNPFGFTKSNHSKNATFNTI